MRKTSTSSSTQPVRTFQHSHSEIASGEDWTDFEYWLRISNDFYTPLLSRGPNIKVLQPPAVVYQMNELIEHMKRLYM